MADAKFERAKKIYENLCTAIENEGWHFDRVDEDLTIVCTARGEDLPIGINVSVDAERELIILLSKLPFTIPEEKILDTAVAVSFTNYSLVDGSFDFNVKDGTMYFRMTSSFIESDIGNDLFVYMVMLSCRIVDDFNDKFVMLGKGLMSLENFMSIFN